MSSSFIERTSTLKFFVFTLKYFKYKNDFFFF